MNATRLSILFAAGLLSLGAAPGSSLAATQLGSDLGREPTAGEDCVSPVGSYCTLASYGPKAPVSGIVTRFEVRATPIAGGPVWFAPRALSVARRDADSITARGSRFGEPLVLVANGQAESHRTRFPIRRGQRLGADVVNARITSSAAGAQLSYRFPSMLPFDSSQVSNIPAGEFLMRATVEPDEDGDGYGDETQDRCPTQASRWRTCDYEAPRVLGIRLLRRTVALTMAEDAETEVVIERRRRGRWVEVRYAVGPVERGRNRVYCGARLPDGRYRVKVQTRDGEDNTGHFVKRFRLSR